MQTPVAALEVQIFIAATPTVLTFLGLTDPRRFPFSMGHLRLLALQLTSGLRSTARKISTML